MIPSYSPETTRSPLKGSWIINEIWQDTGASVLSASSIDIQYIEELYVFRNLDEVRSFLGKFPAVVPILADAYVKIGNYFPSSQLFLEVFKAPELDDDEHLFILIATNFTPDEALKKLSELDDDWWLGAMYSVEGRVSINVEFP